MVGYAEIWGDMGRADAEDEEEAEQLEDAHGALAAYHPEEHGERDRGEDLEEAREGEQQRAG